MSAPPLGWIGIARIGLVQAALGAIVVLTTSTLNRVMVVELHLAATVPGALVGLHYALQVLRPRWGHGSGRRTPWIVGGTAVLAAGGLLAAIATAAMATDLAGGLALAVLAFVLIGLGVGAAGTALLTLLAESVAPERRPAASALVWMTMILGFIVITLVTSRMIAPFSFARLIGASGTIGGAAFLLTLVAIRGVEGRGAAAAPAATPPFAAALRRVWADPEARRFTWFVLAAMLAYSAQDLILEPFAGLVFGLTPAQTTAITSLQNGGTLAGMLLAAIVGRVAARGDARRMRRLAALGCLLSALALAAIAASGATASGWALRPAIAALGAANGWFAVSAVGLMMGMAAGDGGAGVRMGVWGAAQAIGFGSGGFLGAAAVDSLRIATGATRPSYALVVAGEALLFVAAARVVMPPRAAGGAMALRPVPAR